MPAVALRLPLTTAVESDRELAAHPHAYVPSLNMGRKSKWIEIASPDESAVDVARRAIRGRLSAVWGWLEQAASGSGDRVEAVHQLRVATRRAAAALDLFDAVLPPKPGRWFRRRLKQVRKAAGEARDLDVLAERLRAAAEGDRSPPGQSLLARVEHARRNAQRPIAKIERKLRERGFGRRARRIVRKIRWRRNSEAVPTILAAARTGMCPIAQAFFAAAEGDFADIEALHEFRIAGKRLRYSLEVFAGALPPGVRQIIYPEIEHLQRMLGEINDHSTGRDRYLKWLDETHDESERLVLGKLIALETAGLQESTAGFRRWWTPERAGDLKDRFLKEVWPLESRCA